MVDLVFQHNEFDISIVTMDFHFNLNIEDVSVQTPQKLYFVRSLRPVVDTLILRFNYNCSFHVFSLPYVRRLN